MSNNQDENDNKTNNKMCAIQFTKYGPPSLLHYQTDVPKPTIQKKDHHVLVKIYASSINAADWRMCRADPSLIRLQFGLFRPSYPFLGLDIAGIVVQEVGSSSSSCSSKFRVGDEVMADLSANGAKVGGFAEYISVPESALVHKPKNLGFGKAACLPLAGITALQALRDLGNIILQSDNDDDNEKKKQQVLINGASSGVGSLAVQIAKSYGAEVTAVCSGSKMDMWDVLKDIGTGPDHLINYHEEDFTKDESKKQRYDIILDAAAYRPPSTFVPCLTPVTGRYVVIGGTLRNMLGAMLFGGKQVVAFQAKPNEKDLNILKDLVEDGKLMPIVDQEFALKDVAQAIEYVEDRKVKGKIVINVCSQD